MFTDEELEEAILNFLRSDVSTPRSERGTRDVITKKNQVYELIAAVFLLRPRAFFSVCWMATNRLRALAAEQLADIDAIIAAAPRASETSAKVESTTDLYNAEASLLSLTSAFSARESGVRGSIGPSVQRFSASIARFVHTELTKNVVAHGEVVKTGEELRKDIAARWATARARHAEVAARTARIESALGEYEQVRLPDVVVGGIMARVQARLAAITTAMEAPDAPAQSRQALLELSAMRVLLKQASQFRTPSLQKAPLTGDAASGALTKGAGVSASIRGSVSGPYYYGPGAKVAYSVDGIAEEVLLPRHSAAELVGAVMSPWVAPADGLVCALSVDGGPVQTVTTAGWSDPAIALAALKALTGVTALWNSSNRLTLRSNNPSATSALRLALTEDAQRGFLAWLGAPAMATATPIPVADVVAAFGGAKRIKATRIEQRVELATPESGPAVALVPTSGAAALGLAAQTYSGATGTFACPAPFQLRGVVPGDRLVLAGDPAAYRIESVTAEGLTFSPARPPSGAVAYEVRDGALQDYLDLAAALESATREWDLAALDQGVSRLIRGARYVGEIESSLSAYRQALQAVLTLCDGYAPAREPAVEEVVRTLIEHGFDRARDLFLGLELVAFFSLDADGVSYRTWATRTAADAVRVATPVPKDGRDPTMGWRTVAVIPTSYDPKRR